MLYYIFNYNISNGKTNINYNDTNNSYMHIHIAQYVQILPIKLKPC